MELIKGACKERVYPVGRLDRNTIGLLLFTNDGEMATKLMRPKFGVRKIYQVSLDKNLKPDDFQHLEQGIELEDGFIKPDSVAFVGDKKREIGLEIHSGKNRIVRRIFEHLGYDVIKLDRVSYAGLTKKDLPRGKWRFLSPKEVAFLKMIG
jgi:23S rRNA pseudouridine2605 synthase